ncbi:MAG: acyltransferase domain-containing protein, partial [Tumebacillaceae bacterium]
QPVLFAIEYALAHVWMEQGIRPDAMIGHSIGEYVAACLAGVLSLEDALLLVAARGRLMQGVPSGSMLSVPLSHEAARNWLTPELSLAAVNGPALSVIAGPTGAIERLQAELAEQEIQSRILQTSHAFHSQMVDPILNNFFDQVRRVRLHAPNLRWVSGVTGEWISEEQATDPNYWVKHLRETVLFAPGIATLLEAGEHHFLEVGPGVTLSTFVKQCRTGASMYASLQHPTRKAERDDAFLLQTLGKLWADGVSVDWELLRDGEACLRVPLPTYPFERKRYWVDAPYHALYTEAGHVSTGVALTEWETEEQSVEVTERHVDEHHLAPRDELERAIAGIWEEMLGMAPIGVEDNFFTLGGHSLLGLQVLTKMRNVLQLDLPLSLIIEAPTVATMAEAVRERQSGSDRSIVSTELPQIEPNQAERDHPFPLSDLAQAYFVGRSQELEMGNIGSHIYYELMSEDLDLSRFNQALQRLIERHEMLRVVVDEDGMQRILPDVPAYVIEVQDLSGLTEAEQEAGILQLREVINYSIADPARWPLLDVQASRLDERRLLLHVRFDYLIIDALSIEILSREWEQLYRHPELELPELQVSYRDYMMATVALQETELYQKAKAYWWERIPTLPPPPQLPVQRKKLQAPKLIGRQDKLSADQWRRLQARAAQAGITPSGVICTVYAEVLATWSENKHFVLNLPIFGRLPMHPQVNDIVGTFTMNTFLEFDQAKGRTFEQRARQLQEQMMRDLDNRYVSGVRILRELNRLHTDGSRNLMPVIFTGFVKHDNPTRKWSWIDWVGEKRFGSNQSPQIWIDHQVWEDEDGGLFFKWDMLEEVFPEGACDAMFAAYHRLLTDLVREES